MHALSRMRACCAAAAVQLSVFFIHVCSATMAHYSLSELYVRVQSHACFFIYGAGCGKVGMGWALGVGDLQLCVHVGARSARVMCQTSTIACRTQPGRLCTATCARCDFRLPQVTKLLTKALAMGGNC